MLRTIVFCCRHDFWLMHSSRQKREKGAVLCEIARNLAQQPESRFALLKAAITSEHPCSDQMLAESAGFLFEPFVLP
jgi:hypothetical protein